MTGASGGNDATQLYACLCLNVRITTTAPPSDRPAHTSDPAYVPVFVGDEGVTVAHPQLTKCCGEESVSSSVGSSSQTLICLLCELPIYRVIDNNSQDSDHAVSGLGEDLGFSKTANGWIEVHKDALGETAIHDAQLSSTFSPAFSLLFPPMSSHKHERSTEGPPADGYKPPTDGYFAHMPSLSTSLPFFPPGHEVGFLAGLAVQRSMDLRKKADAAISKLIGDEFERVKLIEKNMRAHIQRIIIKRQAAEAEMAKDSKAAADTSSSLRPGQSNGEAIGTPIIIRDFTPVPVPLTRSVSLSVPRVSALSASLATSSMPRSENPLVDRPTPSRLRESAGSPVRSSHSDASTLVQSRGGPASVLLFPRKNDDSLDLATSFRYKTEMEAAKLRVDQEENKKVEQDQRFEAAGPSQLPSAESNSVDDMATGPVSLGSASGTIETDGPEDTASHRARSSMKKMKRKVTFDVIVSVSADAEADAANDETDVGSTPEQRDMMIFALDEHEDAETESRRPHQQQQGLHLVEPPSVFRSHRVVKARRDANTGLPTSYASLRPSSLPAPSHIRPIRSQPGVDSSNITMSLPRPYLIANKSRKSLQGTQSQKLISPWESGNISVMTAGHRSTLKNNSKSWQVFARRQDAKTHASGWIPEEEDEDGDLSENEKHVAQYTGPRMNGQHLAVLDGPVPKLGIPGSLPIQIQKRGTSVRDSFSLSSQPEQHHGQRTSQSLSSAAIRKAVYLERDRDRLMDPGLMDFTVDDEEESDSDEFPPAGALSGASGRMRALRILQKRSELPDSGMWRSLAS